MSDTTQQDGQAPANPNAAQAPGGTHDDPGDLQYGEFGLNGNMTDAIGKALTDAGWDPNYQPTSPDDGVVDIPSEHNPPISADTADGAGQPDPAPSTDTGAQGAGVGGDAPDGAAPDGAPSDPGQPGDADFDANAYFRDYFGTPLDRQTAQQLAATLNDLQNLTPEQRAGLDAVLAGGQPNQYPATTGQPANQQVYRPYEQPVQQPADDPAVAILGPRPEDEYAAQTWDITAQAVRAQQAQIDAVNANIRETTERQLAQQRANDTAAISQAADAWRADYPFLTDAEYDAIADRAAKSGVFGVIAQQRGVVEATRESLEQMLWTDTRLREKVMANLASGRVAGDPTVQDPDSDVAQQQKAIEAARKQRAASVAGGGGQAPSRATHPGDGGNVPSTPEGRKSALTAEIAAHMQG